MKSLYLLIIALFVFTACEKEPDPRSGLSYPGVYTSVHSEKTSQVRLFTVNGEVTDSATVNRFTQQYGKGFLFQNEITTPIDHPDSIRIMSPDTARIYHGSGFFRDFKLTVRSNELRFLSGETYIVKARDMWQINQFVSDLHVAIGRYKPRYREKIEVPGLWGSDEAFKMRGEYFATFSGNHLDYPMLSYVYTIGSRGRYKITYNNLFDPTSYKMLSAGDTLAVQEFRVRYEK